jgi:tetratricopeptide (TPR) repeat protein
MKARLVVSPVLVLLLSAYAPGQQMSQVAGEVNQPAHATANATAFKQELTRRIAVQEAIVRQAESAHATNIVLSKSYGRLGLLYEDAAQWKQSEAAMERAVTLLRSTSEPTEDLAWALSQLGNLHILMGKLRESEKEHQEALKLRQSLGDQLQIARSLDDLSALFLSQNKFEKARDFGQQAMAEFVANGRATALDRISARFTLSRALCSIKDCASAIPLLKAALDEAKATLRPDAFPVGLGHFLLGYAYWKSGDMSRANEYMEQGTILINAQLGWGHPAYLKALQCYATFLHENRNVEAANVVERRIRQAEAVVDVHSLQNGQGSFGFTGLK